MPATPFNRKFEIVAPVYVELRKRAKFTNGLRWAHLDIAGTAWSKKDKPTVPKGATGFGVRLLNRLVADHYEDR